MSDQLYLLATNLVARFPGTNIDILPTHIVEILLYLKPILLFLKDNEICRLYRLYIYTYHVIAITKKLVSVSARSPTNLDVYFFYIRQRDLQII